jgi:hypothetical protein
MTYLLAITIITVKGVTMYISLPFNSMDSCVRAGIEHAVVLKDDDVKETWYQCEKASK